MPIVLDQLKKIELLTPSQIQKLHETINTKYPHSSKQERAVIFAKNIHEVIDHTLLPFDKVQQATIKKLLLPHLVKKEIFSINAYDILETCAELHFSEETTLAPLTSWLNTYQDQLLTQEEVTKLCDRMQSPVPIPVAQNIDLLAPPFLNFIKQKWTYVLVPIGVFCLVIGLIYHASFSSNSTTTFTTSFDTNTAYFPICVTLTQKANHLKPELQYKAVNQTALLDWLKNRDSLLAEEPYFTQILSTAKDFNINPLLLFAITGQEQGFVPKAHDQAKQIASNPFNVYGSWKSYNTSIQDSTRIAAKTIINLSKDCPKDKDPISWLNQKYAEDPHWHKGVSALLEQLEEVAALP